MILIKFQKGALVASETFTNHDLARRYVKLLIENKYKILRNVEL